MKSLESVSHTSQPITLLQSSQGGDVDQSFIRHRFWGATNHSARISEPHNLYIDIKDGGRPFHLVSFSPSAWKPATCHIYIWMWLTFRSIFRLWATKKGRASAVKRGTLNFFFCSHCSRKFSFVLSLDPVPFWGENRYYTTTHTTQKNPKYQKSLTPFFTMKGAQIAKTSIEPFW